MLMGYVLGQYLLELWYTRGSRKAETGRIAADIPRAKAMAVVAVELLSEAGVEMSLDHLRARACEMVKDGRGSKAAVWNAAAMRVRPSVINGFMSSEKWDQAMDDCLAQLATEAN